MRFIFCTFLYSGCFLFPFAFLCLGMYVCTGLAISCRRWIEGSRISFGLSLGLGLGHGYGYGYESLMND